MEEIAFRMVNDSFTVPGLSCLESVMAFNNGLKTINVDGEGALKAGYGIRLKYVDERGKPRCVNCYGAVMFFGVENCEGIVVNVGEDISSEVCGNFVQIRTKIAIYNNNEEKLLTN